MNVVLNKKKVITIVLLLGASFGAGYFSKPDKVTEVVKYKESKDTIKIVTKYVYPDGSTKEQTVEKDKSTIDLDSSKVVENKKLGVRIALKTKIDSEPIYALNIDSPPLLNIYKWNVGLSASVNTNQEIYGGVYVQF